MCVFAVVVVVIISVGSFYFRQWIFMIFNELLYALYIMEIAYALHITELGNLLRLQLAAAPSKLQSILNIFKILLPSSVWNGKRSRYETERDV